VITVISVVGVAAGVMALVIALAINNGFRNTLQRNMLGATAHVNTVISRKASSRRSVRAPVFAAFAWWGFSNPASTRSTTTGPTPRWRMRRRRCRCEDVVNEIEVKLDDLEPCAGSCPRGRENRRAEIRHRPGWSSNRQLLNALKMEKAVTVVTIG
jgi:ABC-type lipoprotein release transport system permease subunit